MPSGSDGLPLTHQGHDEYYDYEEGCDEEGHDEEGHDEDGAW